MSRRLMREVSNRTHPTPIVLTLGILLCALVLPVRADVTYSFTLRYRYTVQDGHTWNMDGLWVFDTETDPDYTHADLDVELQTQAGETVVDNPLINHPIRLRDDQIQGARFNSGQLPIKLCGAMLGTIKHDSNSFFDYFARTTQAQRPCREGDQNIVEGPWTPLLVDMNGDGFLFGERGTYADFDIDADSALERLQWVAPGEDDVFLALDRNANGVVDDGSELFGNYTPLEQTAADRARHGFEALAQYDAAVLGGNGDAVISAADSVWERLLLWNDVDADGVSRPEEIVRISETTLTRIRTRFVRQRHVDDAGNRLLLWSIAKASDAPRRRRVVDVLFRPAGN